MNISTKMNIRRVLLWDIRLVKKVQVIKEKKIITEIGIFTPKNKILIDFIINSQFSTIYKNKNEMRIKRLANWSIDTYNGIITVNYKLKFNLTYSELFSAQAATPKIRCARVLRHRESPATA